MRGAPPLRERYLAYFDDWNRQQFWEAHETLEALWRQSEDSDRLFLQGLIQAAGAFFHVQRGRRGPALVLFRQSLSYLHPYENHGIWQGLDLRRFCAMLRDWSARVEAVAEPEAASAIPSRLPPWPVVGLEDSFVTGASETS